MAYRKKTLRPHVVPVTLSDEEFAHLEELRGDGVRTAFFRALLAQAKQNPESSPVIHKHTWKRHSRAVMGIDATSGRPFFKWVCCCGHHKLGEFRTSADRSTTTQT